MERRGGNSKPATRSYKIPSLSAVCLNSQALGFGNNVALRRKKKLIAGLVKKFDVVTILETHGTMAEMQRWSGDFAASHRAFCSPGATSRQGGMLMLVSKSWQQDNDAEVRYEAVIAGRVGCLYLLPAAGPRCYIMGVHNFELGEQLRVVLDKQLALTRWIRELPEAPGLGLIVGDFNFSAAGAPRWKFEDGLLLSAIGQSASDRSERQKWRDLLQRTLDVTKHEATFTSVKRDSLQAASSSLSGVASVIDHVYVDVEPWQHEFTKMSTGPLFTPFQMKKWYCSDHAPVSVSVSDNFASKQKHRGKRISGWGGFTSCLSR